MSKTTACIIIAVLIIATAIAIGVGVWVYDSQNKYIYEKTVTLDEEPVSELGVSMSDICPGMTFEKKVLLKANPGDKYELELSFEKTGSDTLARYMTLDVYLGDTLIRSASLMSFLSGETAKMTAAFQDTKALELRFVYSMSLEVGDEAQNTTADYTVHINSSH